MSVMNYTSLFIFFSSRRRHTRCLSDWSSDVCSSDLRSCERRTQRIPRAWMAFRRWQMGPGAAVPPFSALCVTRGALQSYASKSAKSARVERGGGSRDYIGTDLLASNNRLPANEHCGKRSETTFSEIP